MGIHCNRHPGKQCQPGVGHAGGEVVWKYENASDIHITYPDWKTEADGQAWLEQDAIHCDPLGKHIALSVALDRFRLGNTTGSLSGRYRAEMHKRYTRF